MASKSRENTATQTETTVIDDRMVQESGQQIVDSIINDNSADVVREALAPTLAAWQTMASSGNLNLVEVVNMGNSVLDMANKSQIELNEKAYRTLQAGVDQFGDLLRQNQLVVEMVDGIADRAFDQSDRSIEILADVKTGDYMALSRSIMLFALAALFIVKRK